MVAGVNDAAAARARGHNRQSELHHDGPDDGGRAPTPGCRSALDDRHLLSVGFGVRARRPWTNWPGRSEKLGADLEALVNGGWQDPGGEVYPRPIAWNVIPFAGSLQSEGYTDEEWKFVNESRKILDIPDLKVEPTCVRVPVMVGHGIAASLWFDRPVSAEEAEALIDDCRRRGRVD